MFLNNQNKSIKLSSDRLKGNNVDNITTPDQNFTPIKRTSQQLDQTYSSKPLDFKYKRRLHPRPASNKIMQLFSPHQFEKKFISQRDIQKQVHSKLNSQHYNTNASTYLNTSDQRSEASLYQQSQDNNLYNQQRNQCARQLIFNAPVPPLPVKKSQTRIVQSRKKQNLSLDQYQQIQRRSNQIQSASKASLKNKRISNETKNFQSECKRNKSIRGGVNPSYLLTFGGDNSSHCSGDQLPKQFLFQSQEEPNNYSTEEIKFIQQQINDQIRGISDTVLLYKTSNFGGKIKQDEISDYSTNVPALSLNGQNITSPFRFNAQEQRRQIPNYEDNSQSFLSISNQLAKNNYKKMMHKSQVIINRHSCPEVNNQSISPSISRGNKEGDEQIVQLALQSLTLE